MPLYLQRVFCDISLISIPSNGLVSHFPPAYIRILLRVISKGRDRLLEIGSNELLSQRT